jgi:hypothetical protein
MSIFDDYKGDQDFEKLPIIKTKGLLNIPFTIDSMTLKENWDGNFGKRNVMIVSLTIGETGEKFTWFAENAVVLSKLKFLKEKDNFSGVPIKVISKESEAGNEYYDLEEA